MSENTDPPEDEGVTQTDHDRPARDNPGDLEQAVTRERARAKLFGTEQKILLGRYPIEQTLGSGGMGTVYLARDPELDRQVAIKVLNAAGADQTKLKQRLVREAQAMAALAHPNVATVHEVDEHDGRTFVVMEYINGPTLRDWLTEREPDWRAILDVYLQAGEGLAAAHRLDLVHRDFKPDNVLIGDDDRVRVTDFGLVGVTTRRVQEVDAATREDDRATGGEHGVPASVNLFDSLTRTGTILGTPAYMAPEQHEGLPTDELSDLFAFCVSLWEALHGRRPFAGDTYAEVREAVLAGAIQPPPDVPRKRRVPGHVRAALEAGLARDPGERPASMAQLLDTLRRDPAVRRRRIALAVAIAGLAGVAAFGLLRERAAPPPLCQAAEARAEIARSWSAQDAAAVRRSFDDTGHRLAEESATHVVPILDRYADEWADMRTEACTATHVTGHQSERMLDLRNACLERRRAELASLVAELKRADATVVERAARAARALTPLTGCSDTQALDALVPVPEDPATRAEVNALYNAFDAARTLEMLGKDRDSADEFAALSKRAQATGHAPLIADVDYERARQSLKQERLADARPLLKQAIEAADAGRHDRTRFLAENSRASVLGEVSKDDLTAAYAGLDRARAIVERMNKPRDLQADLLSTVGVLQQIEGKFDASADSYRRALALRQDIGRDDWIGVSHNELALTLYYAGDLRGALDQFEQAARHLIAAFGPSNVDASSALLNAGNVLLGLGEPAQALRRYRDALAIRRRAYGDKHTLVGIAYVNTAAALDQLERFDESERAYLAALDAFDREQPDGIARVHRNLGVSYAAQGKTSEARKSLDRADALEPQPSERSRLVTLHTRGEIALRESQWAEARTHFEQALKLLLKTPGHDLIPDFRDGVGKAWRGAGAPDKALREHERALAQREQAQPPNAPGMIDTLVAIAEAHLAAAQPARAVDPAERAFKLITEDTSQWVRGQVWFALARALWTAPAGQGQDRARATQLAEQAKTALEAAGPGAASLLAELTQWRESVRR